MMKFVEYILFSSCLEFYFGGSWLLLENNIVVMWSSCVGIFPTLGSDVGSTLGRISGSTLEICAVLDILEGDGLYLDKGSGMGLGCFMDHYSILNRCIYVFVVVDPYVMDFFPGDCRIESRSSAF